MNYNAIFNTGCILNLGLHLECNLFSLCDHTLIVCRLIVFLKLKYM